jgi:16S rRNA processing protein RimM
MLLSPNEKLLRTIKVTSKRITGETVLISAEGIIDRDEAQKLNGLFLAVKREDAAALQAGRYFISDLIGCQVSDSARGSLGVLSDVLQTGANDVLVIKRSGKPDLLVPYLKDVVTSVEIKARKISVVLPDGLYEIYES